MCPIFARDKEAPRPAWHIEIKYGWQAALLGPGEFLALLEDPAGANLERPARIPFVGTREPGAGCPRKTMTLLMPTRDLLRFETRQASVV